MMNPSLVWDDLWHYEPSPLRDDVLLDRERRHPRWRWILQRLKEVFSSINGLKTIELGSGRGDLSVLLAEHGASPTLLDSSPRALQQADRRFSRLGLNAEFVQGDLFSSLNRYPGRFDVALSSGVIEHFRGNERTRAVSAHTAIIKTGGMAIISVPHACCPSYRIWKAYCELRRCWPYGRELPYSKRELLQCAHAAGLLDPRVRCVGFWQSIGDHLGKGIFGRGPDWADQTSRWDGPLGATLVLIARRGPWVSQHLPTHQTGWNPTRRLQPPRSFGSHYVGQVVAPGSDSRLP